MADMDLSELKRIAASPDTSPETLYRLAAEYPQVRVQIAANPATYPGLLEWLGQLGDAQIDAALASRGSAPVPTSAPPAPVGEPAASELTQVVAPQMLNGAQSLEQASVQPQGETSNAGVLGENTQLMDAVPSAPTPVVTRAHTAPNAGGENIEPPKRVSVFGGAAASIPEVVSPSAPAVAPVAGPAGGDAGGIMPPVIRPAEAPAALPVGAVSQTPQHQPQLQYASPASGTGQAAPREKKNSVLTALVAVLAVVALLMVVTVVYFLVRDEGRPADQAGTGATSSQTATPAPTASESAPAGGIKRPAQAGSQEAKAFVTPSGNIGCTFNGDTVSCSILASEYATQCNNGPVTITQSKDQKAVLSCGKGAFADSTAKMAEGDYPKYFKSGDKTACSVEVSGITCWNQSTGKGFKLSRAAHDLENNG